jgi:prepilin-type processing-associated H-X9-DG protein/prepilin-type N-terminal cleavage/methylation domain-containing protein
MAFTLIELLVVIAIIALLMGLLLAAVQKVRSAAAQTACSNQLHQCALALLHYHDHSHRFPRGFALTPGDEQRRFAGWGVELLPYVEQSAAFARAEADFRTQSFEISPASHAGLSTVISAYLCPADFRIRTPQRSERDSVIVAFTSYLGVCGNNCDTRTDGVLYADSRIGLKQVSDGASHTLLLGERPPSHDFHLGWWYGGVGQMGLGRITGSAEMILGVREQNVMVPIVAGSPCGPGVYSFKAAAGFSDPCGAFHFWSPHGDGANFAFCDGSVHFLRHSANDALPELATRAGGESVEIP